jgi:hypothetical protein
MPDAPETVAESSISAADAFSVLANQDRLDILLALGDANERTAVHSLSFEELRRRSGVADSGRFNYHLKQLLDVFVTKDDQEYDLLYPGVVLYRAVRADLFTARPRTEPFDVGTDCHECGAGLQGEYSNQILVVDCPDCGALGLKYYVPPAVVRDGEVEEILAAGNVFSRRDLMTVANHVCPTCANRITHEVVPAAEQATALESDVDDLVVVHYCFHCDHFLTTTVGALLLYEPAVVSFLHDHGVDGLRTPMWDLEIDDVVDVTLVERDPAEILASLELGGEVLEVELDADITVDEITGPRPVED